MSFWENNFKLVWNFFVLLTGDNGQKVLLVAIPRFSKTNSCVLVNLRTLSAHELQFSSHFTDSMDVDV
jgi:hypothetical protein